MTSTLPYCVRPARLDIVASLAQPDLPAAAVMAILDQLKAVIGCLRHDQ